MQGHLSAFKPAHPTVAGTGLLSFVAAPRSFAQTGAGAASDALLFMRRAGGSFDVI
jgi:hypothetical protein